MANVKSTPSPDLEPKAQDKQEAPHKRTPGSSLVPTITPGSAGVERRTWYWAGVLPACPVESLDVAGVHFPKVQEEILPGPNNTKRRVPKLGALVRLTERHLRALEAKLPYKVLRFLNEDQQRREVEAAEAEETAGGKIQNLGDAARRARRGYPVNVPEPLPKDAAPWAGRNQRRYVPQAGDEPAARFMFLVPCQDQGRPTRGEWYPEPLEVTGLEWPAEE